MIRLMVHLLIITIGALDEVAYGAVYKQLSNKAAESLTCKCCDILRDFPESAISLLKPEYCYELTSLNNPLSKTLFLQAFKSNDKYVQKGAIYGLISLGERAYLKKMKEYLKDEDYALRYWAANDLLELGDKEGADYLRHMIKVEGEFKRSHKWTNVPQWNPKIVSPTGQTESDIFSEKIYKIRAMCSLARAGDKGQIEKIREYFTDPNWSIRLQAFECLKGLDHSAYDLFRKDLSNSNEVNRAYTAETLLDAGDRSGVPVLKEALKSDKKSPRLIAALDLLCVGDKTGWDIIRPVLEKKEFGPLYDLAKMECEAAIPYIKELLHESDKKKKLEGLELASMMNDPSLIKDIEPLLDDQEVKYVAAIVILKLLNSKKESERTYLESVKN